MQVREEIQTLLRSSLNRDRLTEGFSFESGRPGLNPHVNADYKTTGAKFPIDFTVALSVAV